MNLSDFYDRNDEQRRLKRFLAAKGGSKDGWTVNLPRSKPSYAIGCRLRPDPVTAIVPWIESGAA